MWTVGKAQCQPDRRPTRCHKCSEQHNGGTDKFDHPIPIKRELMLRASPDKERHERQQLLITTVLLTTALGSRGCVVEFASALVEDFGFVGVAVSDASGEVSRGDGGEERECGED